MKQKLAEDQLAARREDSQRRSEDLQTQRYINAYLALVKQGKGADEVTGKVIPYEPEEARIMLEKMGITLPSAQPAQEGAQEGAPVARTVEDAKKKWGVRN